MNTTHGSLYGIGVGPGDPELITRKGYRILQETPIICIPKKSPEDDSFALSIVNNYIDHQQKEIVDLIFPMTRDSVELKKSWEVAADTIYYKLSSGADCALITEGDPFFYSTFLHTYTIFQQKYPSITIEVVPGVTAMNASCSRALFPLIEGKGKIAVLPARYHIEELEEKIQKFDTVVLLKVHSVIGDVLTILKKLDHPVTILFVQRCGTKDEVVITDIASLDGIKPDYLSLLIIKKG